MRELNSVKTFAQESNELYKTFRDYCDHVLAVERGFKGKKFSDMSLDAKEKVINKLFADEVAKRSGYKFEGASQNEMAGYSQNPMVKFFADQISSEMIDMILPEVINSSVGLIADVRYVDWGDSAKFDLENNALFNVSKAGYRQKNALFQKLEDQTITLAPVAHEVSVITNLFNVLCGRDSIAKYIIKAVKSIEAEMLNEAWSAFTTAVSASTVPSALKVTNYAENSAIKLAETITAWNGGAKAVFAGTPVALKALLPSNANYRYTLDDTFVKLGYVPTFNNYDVMPMPQVANYASTDYGMKLDDAKIYVVSPTADKVVKIVVGGTMSRVADGETNANLTTTGTIMKAWETACITNSIAGYIGTATV